MINNIRRYILLRLALLVLITIVGLGVYSQTFEIRTNESNIGYLEVQMRETSGTNTPDQSLIIIDITFSIKWLVFLNADIELVCTNNPYNIIDGLSARQSSGSYHYRYWNADNAPFYCPDDWVTNEWQTIATFKVSSGVGTGAFIVCDHGQYGRFLNWNQMGIDFQPTPNGYVVYEFPKDFYTRTWVGGTIGSESDWNTATNWIDECGESSLVPTAIDDVLIPDVSGESGFFPETMSGTNGMYCNNIMLNDNAHIYIPSDNGNLNVGGSIQNLGEVKIMPDADITVAGTTFIDKAEGMVISSDISGTGSFIDNGTITYGTDGSVKVETFLENDAAAPGTFYFHSIGPTVDSPYYTGTGTGILLGSFDINALGTWAYEWLEPVGQWSVIYWIFHEIPTTQGFNLSTIDQTNHTLSMTGELITGSVESIPVTYGGSNIDLICNPYPSALDFDAVSTLNSSTIASNYQAWDPAGAGNYAAYSVESGGTNGATQYIQVGQSVFFETVGFGNLSFNNSQRTHDNAIFFKSGFLNRLSISVIDTNFSDEVIIHFMDSMTYGYDEGYDVSKWTSMIPEALDLRCIASDNSELAINALPLNALESMYSVPVNFTAHDSSSYTMSYQGIETFNNNVEIWLEDKKVGGNWINMEVNQDYIFEAIPNDSTDRFNIHFFDPTVTSNDEIANDELVYIYSNGNEVIIINESNLYIDKISVFSLSGSEILSKPGNYDFENRLLLPVESGYYIVRVILKNKVINEKVFISK